jgi:hypothetical protein
MVHSETKKRQGRGGDGTSPSEADLFQFLPCERFQLLIKIKSLMVLPPYKGGIFHGAFGNTFRRAVCAIPRTRL